MKASAREFSWEAVPSSVQPYLKEDQVSVSPGWQYRVHAVSMYRGTTFLLLIDDLQSVVFLPAWAFDITDKSLEPDWILSLELGGGVSFVLGPEAVAADLPSYSRFVDQEPDAVDAVFQR